MENEDPKKTEPKKDDALWVVRRYDNGMYGCAKVRREDGKDETVLWDSGPMTPDFSGDDVGAIVEFCDRFNFTVRSLVDECRSAVSRRLASQKAEAMSRHAPAEAAK